MNFLIRVLALSAAAVALFAYAGNGHVVTTVLPQEVDFTGYTDRLIVKYNTGIDQPTANKRRADLSAELEEMAGVRLEYIRDMANGALVMRLPRPMTLESVHQIADRIAANALIDYAEPDQLAFPTLVPNDSLYAQ
ncbi:MAG: hypothetical protein ACOVN2_00450, partial [Usitatibacteraceae bacterium]